MARTQRTQQPSREPAAMQRRLDALAQALADLPPHQPSEVADPIFRNGPCPAASAIPAGMPPAMAASFVELQAALTGPLSAPGWPIVNTPLLDAQQAVQRVASGGRPSTVQPHQIVRLVRFVRLGHTITDAAGRAQLKRDTARRILTGQHPLCRHPAVLAAGLDIPAGTATARKTRAKPAGEPQARGSIPRAPSSPSRAATAPQFDDRGVAA